MSKMEVNLVGNCNHFGINEQRVDKDFLDKLKSLMIEHKVVKIDVSLVPASFSEIDKNKNPDLKMGLENILTSRPYNILRSMGVYTVEDLIQLTEEELLSNHNFGKKSLWEIKEQLNLLGLSLRNEDEA